MFIRHYPPPLALHAFCRVPTVSEELIGGTGTPPAGTRWGGCIHLQFLRWKGTAVRAHLRRLSLFAHIISSLANTARWLVPPQRGAEAQTFLTFYIGLHGTGHFLFLLQPSKGLILVSGDASFSCLECRSRSTEAKGGNRKGGRAKPWILLSTLLSNLQVAKAPCCAEICSVLSVPAKEEFLPPLVCVCGRTWRWRNEESVLKAQIGHRLPFLRSSHWENVKTIVHWFLISFVFLFVEIFFHGTSSWNRGWRADIEFSYSLLNIF